MKTPGFLLTLVVLLSLPAAAKNIQFDQGDPVEQLRSATPEETAQATVPVSPQAGKAVEEPNKETIDPPRDTLFVHELVQRIEKGDIVDLNDIERGLKIAEHTLKAINNPKIFAETRRIMKETLTALYRESGLIMGGKVKLPPNATDEQIEAYVDEVMIEVKAQALRNRDLLLKAKTK